jgi:hypothetical protein
MTPALHKIWCDEDEHTRYEHFADFNEWLDSEEGQAVRVEYGVDALPQPSKVLFSGDRSGYDEAYSWAGAALDRAAEQADIATNAVRLSLRHPHTNNNLIAGNHR